MREECTAFNHNYKQVSYTIDLLSLMRFIVGENGPSKRLRLCASVGWFADF